MKKETEPPFNQELDGTLLSPVRLPIVVILTMYDEVDFTFLKRELRMSDGNLGANLRKLEDEKYITCKKKFIGRKPKSTYKISAKGMDNLIRFIDTMKGVEKAILPR